MKIPRGYTHPLFAPCVPCHLIVKLHNNKTENSIEATREEDGLFAKEPLLDSNLNSQSRHSKKMAKDNIFNVLNESIYKSRWLYSGKLLLKPEVESSHGNWVKFTVSGSIHKLYEFFCWRWLILENASKSLPKRRVWLY